MLDVGEPAASQRFDVIVVGAGIIGSCAAYAAASRGARAAAGAVRPASPPRVVARRVPHHPRHLQAGPLPAHGAPLGLPLGRGPGGRRVPRAHAHAARRHGPKGRPRAHRRHQERRRCRGGGRCGGGVAREGGVQGARRVDGGGEPVGRRDEGDQGGGHVPGARGQEGRRHQGPDRGRRHHQARRKINPGEDCQWRGVLLRQVHHNGRRLDEQVKSVTGMDLPVQPMHVLDCYWKLKPGHEREITVEAPFPTFASYGTPFIYSTPAMEFPGLIKIAMNGGLPCDPDSRDWSIGGPALVEPVARWINTVMPGHVETAGGPVIRQSCMYSMTPDENFVIDFLGGEFGRMLLLERGFPSTGSRWGRPSERSSPRWPWTGRRERRRRLGWISAT